MFLQQEKMMKVFHIRRSNAVETKSMAADPKRTGIVAITVSTYVQ